jgi:hypothetical protein
VQVLSGVTGLGLPPVSTQWLEGAGDGAQFRGRRVLSRDIDLPLLVQGRDRAELKSLTSRLAMMLSGKCTLYFTDDRDEEWYADVYRVGGGSFTYGVDTRGNKDLLLVVTVRSGDPYFTSTALSAVSLQVGGAASGLLSGSSLSTMQLAPADVIGTVTLTNAGDADAFPVWTITGPGNNFQAISPSGETLQWTGTLAAGQSLVIDTKAGTVIDQGGANRYDLLAAMPRFWKIPPGTITATAQLAGTTPGTSSIRCEWRPRKWVTI